jgi:hypothetical protein
MWTPGGWMWTPGGETVMDTGSIDMGAGGQIWEPRVGEKNCYPAADGVSAVAKRA